MDSRKGCPYGVNKYAISRAVPLPPRVTYATAASNYISYHIVGANFVRQLLICPEIDRRPQVAHTGRALKYNAILTVSYDKTSTIRRREQAPRPTWCNSTGFCGFRTAAKVGSTAVPHSTYCFSFPDPIPLITTYCICTMKRNLKYSLLFGRFLIEFKKLLVNF